MSALHTNNGVSDIFTIYGTDGSTATVHSQGAHITSWVGKDGTERLYMSPNAVYQAGKALRGGVPVIYPQFSDMGSGDVHGAVRNRQWTRVDNGFHNGIAIFEIPILKEDTSFPGYESQLTLTITVSDEQLKLTAKVDKTTEDGTTAKNFGFAFHTYFAVSDISNIKLQGFSKGMPYADNLKNRTVVASQDAEEVTVIDKEVDRIYTQVQNPLMIIDEKFELTVLGENLPDVVLWNPWKEKNARLADLPQPDGYRSFVCIEHGVLLPRQPFPKPGDSWEGSQVISYRKK